MQTSGLKPGQTAPVSGRYQQIGPRGGRGAACVADKGEPLPFTSRPGATYTLLDRVSIHGNGASPRNKQNLALLTKKGRLLPGANLDSRANLYDLMDGLD